VRKRAGPGRVVKMLVSNPNFSSKSAAAIAPLMNPITTPVMIMCVCV